MFPLRILNLRCVPYSVRTAVYTPCHPERCSVSILICRKCGATLGDKTDMPDAVESSQSRRWPLRLYVGQTMEPQLNFVPGNGLGMRRSLGYLLLTSPKAEKPPENLDLGFTSYTRPVVTKGPEQDYVFTGASTAQSGYLLARIRETRWSGGETVSSLSPSSTEMEMSSPYNQESCMSMLS